MISTTASWKSHRRGAPALRGPSLRRNAGPTQADGYTEREAAKAKIYGRSGSARKARRRWVADKGYDAAEFVEALQEIGVVTHIAQNTSNLGSADPDEVARSDGYAISQTKRKLLENDGVQPDPHAHLGTVVSTVYRTSKRHETR